MTDDRLQYLTVGELREEIAYTVGGDPTRYGVDSDRGLKKADLVRIATQLHDADAPDFRRYDLDELYPVVCERVGGEYRATAGNQWGITRENLKRIHRALAARPPREVIADD